MSYKTYKYHLDYNDLSESEDLTVNPIGWNELGVTFERNKVYNSVLRSFSLSLKFSRLPGAGGDKIEEAYLLKGISTNIDIIVYELNTQTDAYDTIIYQGILDFNPQRFSRHRNWIEAGIIDADKVQKFKAREDINYDINSVVSTDDITIDSFVSSPRDIVFKAIDIYLEVDTVSSITNIYYPVLFFTLEPSNEDAKIGSFYSNDVTVKDIGDRLKLTDGPDWGDRSQAIYENTTNSNTFIYTGGTWTIYTDTLEFIKATTPRDILVQLIAVVKSSGGIPVYTLPIFTETYAAALQLFSYVSVNIDLSVINTGVTLYEIPVGGTFEFILVLKQKTDGSMSGGNFANLRGDLEIDINFTEISPSIGDTSVQSYLPHEMFTRLIQLMTSETDTSKLFYSELFGRTDSEFTTYGTNGAGSLDAFASGWNLRAFPNRAFNVNMLDLFKTLDSIYGIGFGYDRVNDRFYIETIDNFYDSSYFMFDLGEVDKLVIKPYGDVFDSKINSGYTENGEYEDFQGVNEFNLISEHSSPLPVKKTKDSRSIYNGDSIGIELTRRVQYSENSSKDTKQDDKIYFARTDGSYTLTTPSATGFNGVTQYYNIALTPRENLIRNAGILKSALWNHDLKIKWVKSQKDTNISYTNQNSATVNEFDDLTGADLINSQLFVPEIYEFQGKITPDIFSILNTNPHGYVRFTFNGTQYEGFLNSVESGYYNRKATWNLIAKTPVFGDNFIFEDDNNFVFENSDNFVFE